MFTEELDRNRMLRRTQVCMENIYRVAYSELSRMYILLMHQAQMALQNPFHINMNLNKSLWGRENTFP